MVLLEMLQVVYLYGCASDTYACTCCVVDEVDVRMHAGKFSIYGLGLQVYIASNCHSQHAQMYHTDI